MNTWTRTGAVLAAAAALLTISPTARADSWSYIDDDDNRAIMQEVANALADVEVMFGTGPLRAVTAWMPPENYAAARRDAVVINKVWSTGSYDRFAAQINADIASGYHNGGCTPMRTVALHEAAHVIDAMRSDVPEMRVKKTAGVGPRPDLRGVLSGYSFTATGAVNANEALAEAFQAVLCGSTDPTEMELYEMLVN